MLDVSSNLMLSIPVPRATQYVYRGMKSVRVPDTHPVSVRWTREDQEFIDQQASRLGISFSEFVRWCAYQAAVEVNKLEYLISFETEVMKQRKESDFSDWD